jgi:hypothetical protein
MNPITAFAAGEHRQISLAVVFYCMDWKLVQDIVRISRLPAAAAVEPSSLRKIRWVVAQWHYFVLLHFNFRS